MPGRGSMCDARVEITTNHPTARLTSEPSVKEEVHMQHGFKAASRWVSVRQSIDDRILTFLQEQGAQKLDHLDKILPDIGSASFLLAIDRLSREGKILLGPPENGDYLVSAISAARSVYTAF